MKVSTLFLLPVLLCGVACERHSADSLPKHGDHAAPAPATKTADKNADKNAEKPADKTPEKPAAPADAPKFFDGAAPK